MEQSSWGSGEQTGSLVDRFLHASIYTKSRFGVNAQAGPS